MNHIPGQIESLWTAEEHAADKIKHEAIALAQSDPKRTILAWNCHEEFKNMLADAALQLDRLTGESLEVYARTFAVMARAALAKL